MWEHIWHSSIATLTAEIITLPVCTLKTNYQNSDTKDIVLLARKIFHEQGIMGFYRASFFSIFSQVFSTSSKYVIYRHLDDNKFSNKFVNGIISGFLSSVITHPIDCLKIHAQMNKPFAIELKNYGFGILYRGYSKTLFKVTIGSGLFFPIYDISNELFQNTIISSFLSAIISTTIIHPVDYLKTRHIYGQELYQGFNPRIYYKGYLLNMARIVPHFMIVMIVIDILKHH